MADKPVVEVVQVDAVLDGLSSPTSSDVYEAVLPYSNEVVAAVAAKRALAGGGGGGSQTLAQVLATGDDGGGNGMTNLGHVSVGDQTGDGLYVDGLITSNNGLHINNAALETGGGSIATGGGSISTDSGSIDLNGGSITNLADPGSDQDAATKKYVDDNAPPFPNPVTEDVYLDTFSIHGGTSGSEEGTFEHSASVVTVFGSGGLDAAIEGGDDGGGGGGGSVIATKGVGAAHGKIVVRTLNSFGTAGQVLMSDGAGGVVWADLP